MAKKQDPIITLSEALAEMFSDPVANYDAIDVVLDEQRQLLITIRDSAQQGLEFLTALGFALRP